MNRDELIEKVKEAVIEIEPEAEIILYGSRSRGDSTTESDWDLLILLDGTINDERIDKIRYRLYQIEWDSGEVLSSIIRNRKEWHSFPYTSMPLYHKVENEGILL
jgi:predicted nucleotidyltransferase